MNLFTNSPVIIGIGAGLTALLYFILMTINPNLPPAIVFSTVIGYFAYSLSKNKSIGKLEHLTAGEVQQIESFTPWENLTE